MIGLVRFYRGGRLVALDLEYREIRDLSAPPPHRNARAILSRIRAALAAQDFRPRLVEQRGSGWPPLTEHVLARFEGRDPQGDANRVVRAL